MNIIQHSEEELKNIASKKMPRTSNKALIDYPPGEREQVLKRWSLRQAILDAREAYRAAKRPKREASRKRKKSVDPA